MIDSVATLPPHVLFEGESPVGYYKPIGEAESQTPTGELYITTAALYFYSTWV